jgi:DNA-binding NtrC family response regulator
MFQGVYDEIKMTLSFVAGNKIKAASTLKIIRRPLDRKLKNHGLLCVKNVHMSIVIVLSARLAQ